jgi:hypothetical protein
LAKLIAETGALLQAAADQQSALFSADRDDMPFELVADAGCQLS